MPRAIISLFPSSLKLYWSLFIAFLIASMHLHAQEICHYDDLLCFFSPFFCKLFCDRRAYVYTRSMQQRAPSNLVYICPWECIWKKMYVGIIDFIFYYFYLCVIVVHLFFFFPKQLKEIGYFIVFSYSCRLDKKKKMTTTTTTAATETYIEECLL